MPLSVIVTQVAMYTEVLCTMSDVTYPVMQTLNSFVSLFRSMVLYSSLFCLDPLSGKLHPLQADLPSMAAESVSGPVCSKGFCVTSKTDTSRWCPRTVPQVCRLYQGDCQRLKVTTSQGLATNYTIQGLVLY